MSVRTSRALYESSGLKRALDKVTSDADWNQIRSQLDQVYSAMKADPLVGKNRYLDNAIDAVGRARQFIKEF